MTQLDTGISKRYNAAEMVEAYQEATNIIDQAYKELERSRVILKDAFGDDMDVIPDRNYHSRGTEGSRDEVKLNLKKKAWRQIIDRIEIRKVMSIKRADELDKNLENGENLPEITMDAVSQMSEGLVSSAQEFAAEAVIEVFEYLRPGTSDYNRHKTNVKNGRYTLGKKVILTRMVEISFGNYHVNHWRDNQLRAVDAVFHTADGKGMPKGYNGPLIDAINICNGECETDYFRCKVYQNGNLHLEFKRPDLVTKLNRVAGGARLSGN